MKKLLTLWILSFLPYFLGAQTDKQASEILDKVFANLSGTSGIRIEFKGTETGILLLRGENFYMNNGNIQSWYDGKTQWSYVADTEEVTISYPTPEELQAVNPYLILMRYKTDFSYKYIAHGKKGHEIVLIPKHSDNKEVIRVVISDANQPVSMQIEQNGQIISDIHVTVYQANQNLPGKTFCFNKSLYPNAEIIDLR